MTRNGERGMSQLEYNFPLSKLLGPCTCAATYRPARMRVSFPATTNASVTAGLRWPPEMAPVVPAKKQIANPCANAMATNLPQLISWVSMPAIEPMLHKSN